MYLIQLQLLCNLVQSRLIANILKSDSSDESHLDAREAISNYAYAKALQEPGVLLEVPLMFEADSEAKGLFLQGLRDAEPEPLHARF